ncbi:MAG: hypothetical protein N2321_11730 [Melioribacteraceae bacterium]|nr:hypothetical protein [Melioribacteraceae bacterium]
MKKLLTLLIIIFIYSCSTQKEIVKEKEEIKIEKPVLVEKEKEYNFSIEIFSKKINSNLRGLSVIDSLTLWASGSNGLIIRTTDGGKTWQEFKVKGFETLDFRDIEAFDKNNAIVMSIDAPAFFFRTSDGGKTWKRKYMNRDPKIFFNGFAFWDDKNGIAFSDPIDGKFYLVTTKDAGETWKEITNLNIPQAYKNEGGFAASGTSITVKGKELVWFGTGGLDKARIYFSEDGGNNWRIADTPMKFGNSSSGIFSIAFKDDLNGVAIGGDYKEINNSLNNCSITDDGGLTWQKIDKNPFGYKSCVVWNDFYKIYLATGNSGTDFSKDDGKSWSNIDSKSFNSISVSKNDGATFLVGDKGLIAKLKIKVE